jgi:hypothetical protein
MKPFARSSLSAIAVLCLGTAPAHAAANDRPGPGEEKPGSLYLQCDGKPNNMTTGESAARLLGAVTLLGLFAPRAETADASKRKRGEEGVAACSPLIEGERKEGNGARRVDLILARAIHQIEAKKYEAALADAALARDEARAAGLLADPYYARSQGRASDLIEAAALYRLNRTDEAREAALRSTPAIRYSILGLLGIPRYLFDGPSASAKEADYLSWRSHGTVTAANLEADRLEEWGKFAEAAQVRDALVEFNRAAQPDMVSSAWLAKAAVAHALAGRADVAAERIAAARSNIDKRRTEGKPEAGNAEIVELLDLHTILRMTADGDVSSARRLFSARSQWVEASFGSVVETTRRLRAGAAPADLIGSLARDPETMWRERLEAKRAEILAKDTDNKTLFSLLPGMDTASSYQSVSKQVWRTDKSKLVMKIDKPAEGALQMERMFLYAAGDVALDAYSLHAALLAKKRGHQGFVIMPQAAGGYVSAAFKTGNRGEPGMAPALFNDADEVIANLSALIPDPETLKAIKAQAAKR